MWLQETIDFSAVNLVLFRYKRRRARYCQDTDLLKKQHPSFVPVWLGKQRHACRPGARDPVADTPLCQQADLAQADGTCTCESQLPTTAASKTLQQAGRRPLAMAGCQQRQHHPVNHPEGCLSHFLRDSHADVRLGGSTMSCHGSFG
jgi:hypothetical protein